VIKALKNKIEKYFLPNNIYIFVKHDENNKICDLHSVYFTSLEEAQRYLLVLKDSENAGIYAIKIK